MTARRSAAASRVPVALAAIVAGAVFVPAGSAAGEITLHPRAWEAGFSTATSTVAGNTRGTLTLRTTGFLRGPRGLVSGEIATSYSHVSSLDELGLGIAIGWVPGGGPLLPFVAGAGGVRQEWIGSFREARWPVGLDVGVRFLLSPRVGLRGEYRFRRVLGDPVADFSEHEFVTGLSVFWNNEL